MIHFKLVDIEDIESAHSGADLKDHYVSCFFLTNAELWLTFGKSTIYEYTPEAMDYINREQESPQKSPYNVYQLSRFIEDFTHLFKFISESVPSEFHELTNNINAFYEDAKKWLYLYDTDENIHSDFNFEEYQNLTSWAYSRSFDSAHLIGGPYLSFYRNKDKITIVWDTDYKLENGIKLFTAKTGSYEMNYIDFVANVEAFGEQFFQDMDKQVAKALAKEWGSVQLDKNNLVKEHHQRKIDFYTQLAFLKEPVKEQTDWKKIELLFIRMKQEINNDF